MYIFLHVLPVQLTDDLRAPAIAKLRDYCWRFTFSMTSSWRISGTLGDRIVERMLSCR